MDKEELPVHLPAGQRQHAKDPSGQLTLNYANMEAVKRAVEVGLGTARSKWSQANQSGGLWNNRREALEGHRC